jgi:protein involved in sex pheromone biosynthesis
MLKKLTIFLSTTALILVVSGCDSDSNIEKEEIDNRSDASLSVPKPIDGDTDGSKEFPPTPPTI